MQRWASTCNDLWYANRLEPAGGIILGLVQEGQSFTGFDWDEPVLSTSWYKGETMNKHKASSNCDEHPCASLSHRQQSQRRLANTPGKHISVLGTSPERDQWVHVGVLTHGCVSARYTKHNISSISRTLNLSVTQNTRYNPIHFSQRHFRPVHCHWCNSLEIHGITPGRKRLAV